jgi:hypothetical protein
VLVYDLDRLHRQRKELEDFIGLCEQLRLTNVASASGDIDFTTADGQFQARILAAVARKESDDKSLWVRKLDCADEDVAIYSRIAFTHPTRSPSRRARPAPPTRQTQRPATQGAGAGAPAARATVTWAEAPLTERRRGN